MCRHIGYLGPETPLSELILSGANSLLRQSWAPREMRGGGTINADGFGVAWADPDDLALSRRYRRETPMWSDESLPDLAESIYSGAIVAAVRSATVGMPVSITATAPFVHGSWMFSHNGVVAGWPTSVAPLANALDDTALMTLEAPTDSAFLWALVRHHLGEGHTAAESLRTVVTDVLALAPESRLNLLLSDGDVMAATAVQHSLWVLDTGDSVTVSSEPLDPDDTRWTAVADLQIVETTSTACTIRPLTQG